MGQIIYVDVLVIINIYINYGLLLLTCLWRKHTANRLRLLLSALFGGVYSLIIVIPHISDTVIAVSRIFALGIMVYLAFGFGSKKLFLKFSFSFLSINFLFAGVMFMLWYLAAPDNMYFNSGVVYFNIDTLTLVLLTVAAYGVLKVVGIFTKNKAPDNSVYTLEINIGEKTYFCRALYDTGNSLTDPFSGEGVIIVSFDILKDLLTESIFIDLESAPPELKMKLIPVKSVGGTRLLPSFRADSITVKDYKKSITIPKAPITVCEEKIHGGDFGAILYSFIFENTTYEKGEDYVLHRKEFNIIHKN